MNLNLLRVCVAVAGLATTEARAQSYSPIDVPFVQFRNTADQAPIRFQQGRQEEGGRTSEGGILKAQVAFQPGAAGLVILMHGCAGTGNTPTRRWHEAWHDFFWKAHYSVMQLDSFSTRGVVETCGTPDEHWSYRRRDDAYSALVWLASQGRTDMSNVRVMGRSNGGRAVLRIMDASMAGVRPYRFASGYAMYPNCRNDRNSNFYAPTYVFIGTDDDANPASLCAAMRDNRARNAYVTIFDGALHGFDDGTRHRVDHGWRMGQDPAATAKTRALIAETLGADNPAPPHRGR